MVRDLVSMAAAATEWCNVWPKTAAQGVKCVWAHCRGVGSSRHPAIFQLVFGELVHANIAQLSDLSYSQSPVIVNDCSNFSNHFLVPRC